ncbi:MAG: hypothetical protein ABSF90_25130 [Syntrophobacteraceae bacterium]
MKKFKILLLFAVLIGCVSISHAIENITPMPPLSVPGQIPISSTQQTITPDAKSKCTLLNLDKPSPNHVFTAYIGGSDRGKFEKPPEELYYGEAICVTGMIELYQGRPEIIVKDPSQIKAR